jgi:cyclophilin family peptidyl-prolyl cis-trans isomerase
LAELDHLTDSAFFDVDKSDVARFGPTPPLEPIKDEVSKVLNSRGTVSFGKSSQSGRVDELFINYRDNTALDRQGVAPIGEVIEGMGVLDRLYDGYGDRPDKSQLASSGNAYLDKEFPKSPKIKSVEIWEAL